MARLATIHYPNDHIIDVEWMDDQAGSRIEDITSVEDGSRLNILLSEAPPEGDAFVRTECENGPFRLDVEIEEIFDADGGPLLSAFVTRGSYVDSENKPLRALLVQSLKGQAEITDLRGPNGRRIFQEVLTIQTNYDVYCNAKLKEGPAIIRIATGSGQQERTVVLREVRETDRGWKIKVTPTY